MAFPFSGLYAASKFALEGLTEAYRLELLGHGIDVAIVEPGRYPTGIGAKGVLAADSSRFNEYPAAAQAHEQFAASSGANPQAVADAIGRLVALHAGTRPLRTVVADAAARQSAEALNAASDQVIRAVMNAIGLRQVVSPTA